MRTIGWGMIGCGDVTEQKNGPGLYKAQNSRLVGVFNRTEAKARDWVKRHGAGTVYPDVEAMLANPEIDIVYVATTPDCHKRFAVQCAQAGKHCYLEKPIARSLEEAEALREAFAQSGTKLFIAHYRRAMERFRVIKQLLDSGAVGTLRAADVVRAQRGLGTWDETWRIDTEMAGGGPFFEGEVHLLDLLDFFLGGFREVQLHAIGARGREERISLSATTGSGALVSGLWDFSAPEEADCIRIFGSGGSLSFPYNDNSAPVIISTEAGIETYCPPVEAEMGTPMIQLIVDELNGQGSCPSTLESAMRSFRIAARAVELCR